VNRGAPAPRRRRWLLWTYLGLLVLSHLVRWARPASHSPDPDERVQPVALADAAGRREQPVRIAYRLKQPIGSDSLTPTLVLIHGSPGDNGEVSALTQMLGMHYRSIAPDLPGFGGSDWSVPDYSNIAHARYLLALLDSLKISRAHLVGFSMGGGVALQMEAMAPGRVRSITMLAAIGAQEYELVGDYHLNHAIHALQLGALWLVREAGPHFGRFDDGMLSVEYARNFYDTDQRPLRTILSSYAGPMLILQGENDPLVNPATAREHARIVAQAELHMDNGDHFTAFTHPERIAGTINDFVDRVEHGRAATRATAEPDRIEAAARPFDPASVPKIEGLSLVIIGLLIMLATLVSEDLTCITTGLMIARGTIGFFPGTLACFLGIFLGDLLVFVLGRTFGRTLLTRAPINWFITPDGVALASQWIERQGATLVFTTRFLPGTRLPSYFAAGMLRTRISRFALYFFIACALWTPALVALSAAFGEVVQDALKAFEERAGLYLLVTGGVLFLLLKILIPLCTWRGRRLLLSRWRRLSRWEFWPRWAFYPPVVLYVLWLGLKHRSLRVVTAVNPAIPAGGLVGESKAAILDGIGEQSLVARYERLPGTLDRTARLARVDAFRARHGLDWPIVLKPDVGERGSGVGIIRSQAQAENWLVDCAGDAIVQEYVAGQEYGIFYVRRPGEATGRIFAITDKRFTAVRGTGQATLEELILRDDRAVCMAPFHLQQHYVELASVPPLDAEVPLVELGTHCRGATFLDGAAIETPALASAIDRLSQSYPRFWFGRYDIRVPDLAAFQAGHGFKVVELNGATSEATSIYDPKHSLGHAYRVLFEQWRLAFEIGATNVRGGARMATWGELWRMIRKGKGEKGKGNQG
jgi:membrane protein DedA with SNARE-associated domain/pimeloyl-ACP methyl ester carboxylesterase